MNVEYSLFYSATILSRSANKADYINEWGCQLPNVFFLRTLKPVYVFGFGSYRVCGIMYVRLE